MIVVLGAGLAGLSTATYLRDVPHLVLEQEHEPGGLARSVGEGGFLFDFTGHLLHLRTPEVTALIDDLLGDDQIHLERSAWVRFGDRLVPYPFQVHSRDLPVDVRLECITGFAESLLPENRVPPGSYAEIPPDQRLPISFLNVPEPLGGYALSFAEWTERTFGRGFARHFFKPYNAKNFACDVATLSSDWVSWAIPKPDLEDVLRGALGASRKEFGYNPRFRYPASGGIRRLPDAMASRLDSIEVGRRAKSIDSTARRVRMDDGEEISYETLVTTNPLPELVAMIPDLPDEVRAAAGRLRWCAVRSFNFGLDAPLDHDRHWIYFPDPALPFYRVGFPSNLTPSMSPEGRGSVCAEVAVPPSALDASNVRNDDAEEQVLAALVRTGVIPDAGRVTTRKQLDLPYAYVLFDDARRAALPIVFRALFERGIIPIGRFGSWNYLSMETTIQQGIETARWLRDRTS